MALYKGRCFRSVLWLALLAVTMFSSGCRTTTVASLFTASGPAWHVQEGQALWRPNHRFPELGGELVVASHEDGRCVIQFSKTPLPLVLAQTTHTNWLIRFPAQRMSFAGHQTPPARFAWLYLHPAISGEPLPSDFRFQRKTDGGWRLENTRSGETLEGYLEP